MKQLSTRIQILTLALSALLLYANTLPNDYAFDDHIVTTSNKFVQKGLKGLPELVTKASWHGMDGRNSGLYRPLPMVTHAIEKALFGNNPFVGHLINILLYALTAAILFLTLTQLYKNFKPGLYFPFIATLLFIAHPAHTEVVANIKSRDEILALLNVLLSVLFLFKYLDFKAQRAVQTPKHLLPLSLAFFFFALVSKESAITFVAVIPLMIYVFKEIKDWKFFIKVSAGYVALTLLYLGLRLILLEPLLGKGGVVNNALYGAHNISERWATVSAIMTKYLTLLFFPTTLVCDYSYNQIPITDWGPASIFGFIIFAGLLIFGVIKGRKKNVIAFWILYFFITFSVTSNFFLLDGATMADRYLYAPSLGFCVLLAMLLIKLFQKSKISKMTVCVVTSFILLGYCYKTITRNPDWKNNLTLFSADVEKSPKSCNLHHHLGVALRKTSEENKNKIEKAKYLDSAIAEFKKAIEILPEHVDAWFDLGVAYVLKGDYDSAIKCCWKSIKLYGEKNNYPDAYFWLGNSYLLKRDFGNAIKAYKISIAQEPESIEAHSNLANAYLQTGDIKTAVVHLQAALSLDPGNQALLNNLQYVQKALKNQDTPN